MIQKPSVSEHHYIEPGEPVEIKPVVGSLALDGERKIELVTDDPVEISLDPNGPLIIDAGETMNVAARRSLLNRA